MIESSDDQKYELLTQTTSMGVEILVDAMCHSTHRLLAGSFVANP